MRFKIIIRSLLRQKLHSSIIIISLSIGIACFNLISLFIIRELKTDDFHNDADRIFALKCDDPWFPGDKMYHCKFGSAEYMKSNFAIVKDFCRISNSSVQKIVVGEETYFDTPLIISASSDFFDFFSYRLLTNNPESALKAANSIVISDSLASKYFQGREAVGQIIGLGGSGTEQRMIVSGVFETPAGNTQLKFDMVRLIGEKDSRCYIKLADGSRREEAEQLMQVHRTSIPIVNTGIPGSYYLEPLKSAYFDTSRGLTIEANRNKNDLLIALIVAFMILGIASFNYLGLLNNSLAEKRKDYVMRRINGASRFRLIIEYMAGNGFIIMLSFLLSIFIMLELLPFFNDLTGSMITERYLYRPENLIALMSVTLFLVILTFLFGLFKSNPATDASILKAGGFNYGGHNQIPVFSIFQLSCSIVLLICSAVIIRQMNFISNKEIGLDKNVIEIKLPSQYADKILVFRDELMKSNSIEKVSVTTASPLLEHFLLLLNYEQDGLKKEYSPSGFSGDENYLSVLGVNLVVGENFSGDILANGNKCLINQTFARFFSDRELIGKNVPGMDDKVIIGIVSDFHYSGLEENIEPAIIAYSNKGSHLLVRPLNDKQGSAIQSIAETWEEVIQGYPLNIESVRDRYEWYHRGNKNYLKLIGACSAISLFLSMIGLFAVSYRKILHHRKEIGIRRINGAGIYDILIMLNRDFIKWVIISFIIAVPAGWLAMSKWLQNYAYRAELSWWIFAISGLIAVMTAILTVSWQSLRAATSNPVDAIKYE